MKNKIAMPILLSLLIITLSFKNNSQKYYAYAVVQSDDFKSVYFSTVFSFSEKPTCIDLSKWADAEFVDRVKNFKGGGSQIIPCTEWTKESDLDKVRNNRTQLITGTRKLGKQNVEIVNFPSSKE